MSDSEEELALVNIIAPWHNKLAWGLLMNMVAMGGDYSKDVLLPLSDLGFYISEPQYEALKILFDEMIRMDLVE